MFYRIEVKRTLPRVVLVIMLGALFLLPYSSPLADGPSGPGPIPKGDTTGTDTLQPAFHR